MRGRPCMAGRCVETRCRLGIPRCDPARGSQRSRAAGTRRAKEPGFHPVVDALLSRRYLDADHFGRFSTKI